MMRPEEIRSEVLEEFDIVYKPGTWFTRDHPG